MLQHDPFICDACQDYGYCRTGREFHLTAYEKTLHIFRQQPDNTVIEKLQNALPFTTTMGNRKSEAATQMQKAHDTYHQQDYETAFPNYKALVNDGFYHWEAYLGLTLCTYNTQRYEEALFYIENFEIPPYSNFEDIVISFSIACTNKIMPNSQNLLTKDLAMKQYSQIYKQ